VDISPSARFCISEAEIVTALYNGIKLLKEKEDEAGGAAAGGADAQLLAAQEALLAAQKAVLEVQKLMAKKN